MFLKIVDWISENPHLKPPEKSFKEIAMDESGQSFDKSMETNTIDDNCSNTSTGFETSLLEKSLVGQSRTVDIQQCDEDKGRDLFAGGDSGSEVITNPNNTDDTTQTEAKKEKYDCNQFVHERSSLSRYSTENPVDNIVIKTDTGCSRSVVTQTQVGTDKQCDNVIEKKPLAYSAVDALQQEIENQSFPVSKSSMTYYTEKHRKPEISDSLYGTLFVVGCNKTGPIHLAEKINPKYVLRKRAKANGLVEVRSYVTSDVESVLATPEKHVISYPSGDNHSVVVVFNHDSLSDLFQIGRYETYPIDFKVDDINPLDKARHGVSRFACRISVRRDGNHEAKIYAGAFNSSQAIIFDKGDFVHNYCGKMEGFTTNGILMFKPDKSSLDNWREVSVSGYIYPRRSSKMDLSKRARILEESNVLIDGTLIDLCGVTLIWRTPEGLKKTPSEDYLNRFQSTVYKSAPECTLLSQNSSTLTFQTFKKAYVYLSCGHVVRLFLPKVPDNHGKGWSCPKCRVIGPIKEFAVGLESGFYLDEEVPSCAFKPCGHVASLKTVVYWSSINIPIHRKVQFSICPFCGQKLNFITKYVKLALPI